MRIGDKISSARQQAGMTQTQLADNLHVARQTISSWETGRSYPDVSMLVNLSNLFHTSLDSLLKEDQDMMNDIKKKEAEVKRARMIYVSSLTIDILLVVVLVMYGFDQRHFDLGVGSILILFAVITINAIVMITTSVHYRQITHQPVQNIKYKKFWRRFVIGVWILMNLLAFGIRGLDAYSGGFLVGNTLAGVVALRLIAGLK